jgi:nitroreductase
MNETLVSIKNRRITRKFQSKQISEQELQAILEAGILAPNAKNQQKWQFTVIQKKDLMDRMVVIIKENILKSSNEFLKQRASIPNYHTFYNAPAVIMITADEKAQWIELDCGAAMENMAIAAESMGIGSCVIVSSGFLFESEKGKAYRKELGIAEGYKYICTLALGYKEGENPNPQERNRGVVNYIK